MECERCFTGEEAKYRTYTDIIDMKVCVACADRARKLGIAVEALVAQGKNKRTKNATTLEDCRLDSWIHAANSGR